MEEFCRAPASAIGPQITFDLACFWHKVIHESCYDMMEFMPVSSITVMEIE